MIAKLEDDAIFTALLSNIHALFTLTHSLNLFSLSNAYIQ